jgi:NAD(P)H-nitrite reductase large subunit
MNIIIIGNGIAGTNAARFIRKFSNGDITMISGESEFPFSRTALMYVYMGHMNFNHTKLYEDDFWTKNRIQRIKAWVMSINSKSHTIQLDNGSTLHYDKLIIASGSKSNKFDWPGKDLQGVQGLYTKQDLESMETSSSQLKRAVIVGGGLIGIEMAEMFYSRHIPVTFLVRESNFWNHVLPMQESLMINQEILDHGIDLKLETELTEIIDDGTGQVSGVLTSKGEKINAQFVGLTVGVSPNIEFLENSIIETNHGVLVDDYLQSSQQDIYAIGDCAELRSPLPGRKSVEPIWYAGRMMGQTVAHTICKSPMKYDPGIWFNSAKFFNIEYQVYGDVQPRIANEFNSLFWQHASMNKSIRINYRESDLAVTGFNLMGVRYRQEVCEKWIHSKTSIETVLQYLSLANFDPEFFEQYEHHLLEQYKHYSGNALRLKSKRNLNQVTRFLQKNNS